MFKEVEYKKATMMVGMFLVYLFKINLANKHYSV